MSNQNRSVRQSPSPKKKSNMIVKSCKWVILGIAAGFFTTFIFSVFEGIRYGLMSALADLVGKYFNLIVEISSRNPSLANLILQDQTLAQANIANELGGIDGFLANQYSTLNYSQSNSDLITSVVAYFKYCITGAFYLAEWSLKLDILKFISVFCSFMAFVFAGVLGLLDGLLSRYIRTAEGGRESTYGYHFLADSAFKIPFICALIYLALPIAVSPLLIVVILTLLIFMFFRTSASNLKKFI